VSTTRFNDPFAFIPVNESRLSDLVSTSSFPVSPRTMLSLSGNRMTHFKLLGQANSCPLSIMPNNLQAVLDGPISMTPTSPSISLLKETATILFKPRHLCSIHDVCHLARTSSRQFNSEYPSERISSTITAK
ncbi:unnamed protein product, partial [Protopolystoma xenopodis]